MNEIDTSKIYVLFPDMTVVRRCGFIIDFCPFRKCGIDEAKRFVEAGCILDNDSGINGELTVTENVTHDTGSGCVYSLRKTVIECNEGNGWGYILDAKEYFE